MDDPPLARLPPEIRNEIYSYALTLDHAVNVTTENQNQQPSHSAHPAALSFTCKQLHKESLKMFYAENSFVLRRSSLDREELIGDLADVYLALKQLDVETFHDIIIDINSGAWVIDVDLDDPEVRNIFDLGRGMIEIVCTMSLIKRKFVSGRVEHQKFRMRSTWDSRFRRESQDTANTSLDVVVRSDMMGTLRELLQAMNAEIVKTGQQSVAGGLLDLLTKQLSEAIRLAETTFSQPEADEHVTEDGRSGVN